MRCTLLITGYSFCGAMAGAEEGRFIWCSCTLLVAGCSFYGAMAGAEEGRFMWCSCTLLVAGCSLLVLRWQVQKKEGSFGLCGLFSLCGCRLQGVHVPCCWLHVPL